MKEAEKISGLVFRLMCRDEEQRGLCLSPTPRRKDSPAGRTSPPNHSPVPAGPSSGHRTHHATRWCLVLAKSELLWAELCLGVGG